MGWMDGWMDGWMGFSETFHDQRCCNSRSWHLWQLFAGGREGREGEKLGGGYI